MDSMPFGVSKSGRASRRMILAVLLGKSRLRAADAAQILGVTARTLYRDIDALRAAGFPVEGHSGVGYFMPVPPAHGPLCFSRDELRALVAGLKLVKSGSDAALAGAATGLLKKAQRF